MLQTIWDSLPQGPIDKVVKKFSKRLKACVKLEVDTIKRLQSLHNSNTLSGRLNDVIFAVFALTFLNALKSLDGNPTMLII